MRMRSMSPNTRLFVAPRIAAPEPEARASPPGLTRYELVVLLAALALLAILWLA